jgi:hypothetical protein
MYARTVEEAAASLRELRHEEWEEFGLGLVALALALVAAEFQRPLAMPFFLGAVFVGGLGIRACWRRWDLVNQLTVEPDAYSIPEILDLAASEATFARRRWYATAIRRTLSNRPPYDARIAQVADELDALALELEDPELELAPACAVACRRLVSEPSESALFDPEVPTEDLRATVRRIRLGLTPSRSNRPASPAGRSRGSDCRSLTIRPTHR